MSSSVSGLNAIVTGAGSGINLEFARLLLERGANVLFADLSLRPEAEQVVQQYSGNGNARAVFQKTDVADWTQLHAMFDAAVRTLGGVDIVCPGAGVYEPPWSNFWLPPGSPESKDALDGGRYAILDINITHPIRVTQLAIAHFLKARDVERKPKFIIHISSIAGQKPAFSTPIYVATKHAINGFVRSLARLEQEHGIRVAAVAPGVVKTPLWTPDKAIVVTDEDVWVTPEEVAEAMLALIEKDQIAQQDGEKESIQIEGGTILEVKSRNVRDVQIFNDPGPGGAPGNTTAAKEKLEQVSLQNLSRPGWGLS